MRGRELFFCMFLSSLCLKVTCVLVQSYIICKQTGIFQLKQLSFMSFVATPAYMYIHVHNSEVMVY